jgi:hypothetical protein
MAKLREVGVKDRRIGNASKEEGDPEERFWSKGDQPETGHRHWTQRSSREGREGAVSEVFTEGPRKTSGSRAAKKRCRWLPVKAIWSGTPS